GYQTYARSSYGLELTAKQARQLRDSFFEAYPGLAAWHQQIRHEAWQRRLKGQGASEVQTLAGRRIIVKRDLWHGARAAYTVQGSAGDGIKTALALLWERREQSPGAFPVLVIHDEIVVEADEQQASAAADWLKAA